VVLRPARRRAPGRERARGPRGPAGRAGAGGGAYALDQITENLETLLAFRRHLERNANAQLATEVLMLKLIPRKAPQAAAAA
jgi:hypothetical protein